MWTEIFLRSSLEHITLRRPVDFGVGGLEKLDANFCRCLNDEQNMDFSSQGYEQARLVKEAKEEGSDCSSEYC